MIALEGAPDVAALVAGGCRRARETWRVAEAEDGVLSGGASIVTPPSSWTGESAWSGGKYVSLPAGARVAFGSASDSLVQPVAWRTEGSGGGRTAWTAGALARHAEPRERGRAGRLGGARLPRGVDAPGVLRGRPVLSAATRGTVSLDAALVQPLLEHVVLGARRRGPGRGAQLRRPGPARRRSTFPGAGAARVSSYDSGGRLDRRSTQRGAGARPRAPGRLHDRRALAEQPRGERALDPHRGLVVAPAAVGDELVVGVAEVSRLICTPASSAETASAPSPSRRRASPAVPRGGGARLPRAPRRRRRPRARRSPAHGRCPRSAR